jgi:ferredoxin-NADP reductase/DMSO/TMAO reductase YedYZ heme-binding membrane subunit
MTTMPVPSSASAHKASSKPAVWFGGNMPVARWGLILNLLIPFFLLIWDADHHMLGVNAVNFAIHTTGGISVICLLMSLAVTPLRNLTGFTWLIQFRRPLGVYAFYYAAAHLAIYFWWDRQRSLSSTVYEITHRYYLAIGFSSLALMVPLWATSFNAAIQKMGATWWKRLHRLAYLAAALACYHFYLQTKADKRLPDLAIAILAGLLLYRVAMAIDNRVRKGGKVVARGGTVGSTGGSTAGLTAGPAGVKARFWKGNLRVVGMFRETAEVRTFRLAAADGGPIPFAYQAGQFLNLTVEIDGKRVGRSYTIASPPTREAYIELTIKREEKGQVSRFLHDMMMTGHTVSVSAPAGRFFFDPSKNSKALGNGPETSVLLLAGGVGITPVMSILRDLTDRCWLGKIDLVFSVRTPADIIFADELRLLSARHPNLHVHLTCTRDIPADWPGERGRITADLLRKLVPDLVTRPAFICGPDAMAQAARQELINAGVPADRITLESFTPAATVMKDVVPVVEYASKAMVTFSISQKTASVPSKKTILDAAESVGVKIDYQCRSGVCGTCRTRLAAGQVTMENREALSDADEAEGYILACQAHVSEDVTVEA